MVWDVGAASLDDVLAHAPIGFAVFDPALHPQHVNPAMLMLLGAPIDRAAGLARLLATVRDTGAAIADRAFSGVERELVGSCYPVYALGQLVAIACIVRVPDAPAAEALVREQRARERAEQENRRKDQFLAVVSHELRAPITAMLLWERILRDPELDADGRRRALDAIRHSAALQSRMVGDLFDVSRAISGKLHVEHKAFMLESAIDAALDAVRENAIDTGLTIIRDVAPDLGVVLGDAGRVEQILANLLINALKFTPRDGRITLYARRDGEYVVVAVSDTGRGIDPDFLPHVFEPFRQGDDGLTGAVGGLGLGLAIARELAGLHAGTLAAHSDGSGRGATFTLQLPAAAGRPSPQLRPRAGALDGTSVIVVDDDVCVLGALELLLGRAGARVRAATSAAAAWQQLQVEPADVLLSDIAMPQQDGYLLMRQIRSMTGPASRLPAIALSAYGATTDRDRALASGFDVHFAKPIDIEKLIALIARLVGAPSYDDAT